MIDREKVIKGLAWVIVLFSNYERHAMGDEEMQSLNDAIMLLKAQESTVDRWISVKDRLPEENGIYLVCVAPGYMDFYTWSDKTWFSSAFNICDDGFVTHWMPLPSTEGLDET